jgi:hypothetical protein
MSIYNFHTTRGEQTKKSLVFLVLAVLMLTMSSCLIQPKCKKPQFSLLDGDFMSIGSQTYGATIYWTIRSGGSDPGDPHSGSNIYRGKIGLRGLAFPVSIKAQAVKEGYRNSDIASRYLEFKDVFPDLESPADTMAYRM